MLKVEKKHRNLLQSILTKYPYHFYAYGSRVKGNAHQFSDLDICFQEEIPRHIISEISWELSKSNLPFIVELVNWKHMRPSFQQAIQKDLVLISRPHQPKAKIN
jgi:predicted nucleotidyltransferase